MAVVQSLKMKSKPPTLLLGYILVCLAVSIAIPIPATGAFESSRSLAGFLVLWFILSRLNIIPRSWNRVKRSPGSYFSSSNPSTKCNTGIHQNVS